VNGYNFESPNYNQAVSTYGLSSNYSNIVSSPVLDSIGPHSLMLSRSGSEENFVIGQGGIYDYNLSTAYYSFLFEYTSNPSEGGICNFQDTGNKFKAALHLSSPSGGYSNIMFYPLSGSGYPVIGSTPLYAGVVYTISAQIGTGQNAPWQVLINGKIEMRGRSIRGPSIMAALTSAAIVTTQIRIFTTTWLLTRKFTEGEVELRSQVLPR